MQKSTAVNMGEKYIINHNIPKSAEGTYYTIPFPMQNNLEKITVTYSYERDGKNVVDIGLMDNNKNFLGWSGSDKTTIFVGECSATPGYFMTEIKSGEWFIIIGAYKIPKDGLPVKYEITYTPKEYRWLVGDLHIHSNASDRQHDIPTLAKKAIKKGLDFIAVANHNNFSENLTLPQIPDLTLIPAVEWTHYKGHMNFFGVSAPFENFIANTQDEMIELINKAKAKGALISVNHPKDTGCPYLWEDTNCFDLVEVWNAPMRKSNVDAILWWHNLLLEGKRVPLVGGSDYHRDRHPALFAHPITRVYAKSSSYSDILEGLKNGNVYVAAAKNSAELSLTCLNHKGESVIMGDAVSWHEDLILTITVKNLGISMILELVTAEGLTYTWRKNELPISIKVKQSWRFAYLIAKRQIFGFNLITVITNPIYFIKWR